MRNQKFILSFVFIISGITLLGAAHATKWDKSWGHGSIKLEGQPEFKDLQTRTIGHKVAIGHAENEVNGKTKGIILRNMYGYLVYTVDMVTPDNTMIKVVVDAGDGRILFVDKHK